MAGLNIAIRLFAWGNIGNYKDIRTDYLNFFWDSFINQLRILLSPVNPAVFNQAVVQIVGAVSATLLLIGLVAYGRSARRLIILSGAWLFLTLIPVLNLLVSTDDLQQNRFLYLPVVGYCVGVAAVLYESISALKRRRARSVSLALVGCLLLLSIAAAWVQLRPWHTTTVMAGEIDAQTRALIPPQAARPSGMVWYVENTPDTYKGAYLYRLGMGAMRDLTTGDGVRIENVPSAVDAPVIEAASRQDAYAMSFLYDESTTNFRVDYLFGITRGTPSPLQNSPESSDDLRVYDFSQCAPNVLKQWYSYGAKYRCLASQGLLFQPDNSDPRLIGPDMPVVSPSSKLGFVRVRVAVSYPANSSGGSLVNQWYWSAPNQSFTEERSRTQPILQDDRYHVYWTFIRADEVPSGLSKLRFDPLNSTVPQLKIKWIAVDMVK